MKLRLRWKILLLTAPPMVALSFVLFGVVTRSFTQQVQLSLREDIGRAAAVFENMLASRAQELSLSGVVIAQDPRFFAVLALPEEAHDAQYRATVAGVARDFDAITRSDLFEVLDARGTLLASVGPESTTPSGRGTQVAECLSGRAVSGILAEPRAHYQVTLTPVVVGGRVVGALLLGARIGQELAERLRTLTRSDVTFISGDVVTGTTLEGSEDSAILLNSLRQHPPKTAASVPASEVFQVAGVRHDYLTLARPLPLSGEGSGQVFVMQRALDIETAFLREVRTRLTELSLLAALLVLLAGAVISERITSPVLRLVRGAEEMERGNYEFPLLTGSGDEIGYLATRFDEMRKQQRSYVTSLEEVSRLKSRFIDIASHELRTPIGVISGFYELLAEGDLGPVNDAQKKALETIGTSVGKLIHIAEDATRLAQVEGAHFVLRLQDHDVQALLTETVQSSLRAAPGRRVRVTVRDSGPVPASVDGNRLVEALSCLVQNAIRFTPDGGTVELRASRRRDFLEIEVEDTGIGISPEKLTAIFEKNMVLRESKHHHSSNTLEFNSAGLGLGLAIARGIIQAHGGTLEVTSELGQGSTFTVRLPREAAGKMEAAA